MAIQSLGRRRCGSITPAVSGSPKRRGVTWWHTSSRLGVPRVGRRKEVDHFPAPPPCIPRMGGGGMGSIGIWVWIGGQ